MRFPTFPLLCLFILGAGSVGKADPLRVLVTPAGKSSSMRCQVGAEPAPSGQWRWRVTVEGGKAPYHWRLPLYSLENGENRLAASQIGVALLDEQRSFLIEVASQEVQRASARPALTLQLTSESGSQAQCDAPLVREAAAIEAEIRQASFDLR